MKAVRPEISEPDGEGMSFWDHLDELRGVIFRGALVLLVAMALLFAAMPWIFNNIILAPCHPDFFLYRWLDAVAGADLLGIFGDASADAFHVDLINTELTSQFMIHISASFWLALLLCIPLLLMLLWHFVSPGLYQRERHNGALTLVVGTFMFFLGVSVGYGLVFPLTLRFLSGYQLSSMIPNYISISSYMDTLVGLCGVMGLMFELPPVAWLLGRLGILDRSFFSRFRRHAIVALLIAAAIITPTGDPVTLLLVFAPLYLLWELSAMLVPLGRKSLSEIG